MPTHRVQSLSVAANSTSSNQLSQFSDEYLRADTMIAHYAKSDVVGLNVTLAIGERLAISDQPCNAGPALGINVNEDQLAVEPGMAGEKVSLTFRNTTVGAIVVQAMSVFTPI